MYDRNFHTIVALLGPASDRDATQKFFEQAGYNTLVFKNPDVFFDELKTAKNPIVILETFALKCKLSDWVKQLQSVSPKAGWLAVAPITQFTIVASYQNRGLTEFIQNDQPYLLDRLLWAIDRHAHKDELEKNYRKTQEELILARKATLAAQEQVTNLQAEVEAQAQVQSEMQAQFASQTHAQPAPQTQTPAQVKPVIQRVQPQAPRAQAMAVEPDRNDFNFVLQTKFRENWMKQKPFTLLALALDDEKEVVDFWGQDVLKKASELVLDLCIRKWGIQAVQVVDGRTYVMIPKTTKDVLNEAVELQTQLQDQGRQILGFRVSLSGGIAESYVHTDQAIDLRRLTEEALRHVQAKGGGRVGIPKAIRGGAKGDASGDVPKNMG